MEKNEKLRIFAGILLIASAITHNLQLVVYGTEAHSILAALYGVAYGILGVLLLLYRRNQILALLGGIIPVIGGILGISRLILFFVIAAGVINFFIIFHVIVDVIVVPICWYDFFALRKKNLP
ncbi:MAG: hypothetical protein ACTSYC_07775 [Promethearchaeota archaeon]